LTAALIESLIGLTAPFITDVGNTLESDLLTLPIDACKNELFVLMGRLTEGLLITLILLDETIDYDTKNKLVS
jgi:hypothetical protein